MEIRSCALAVLQVLGVLHLPFDVRAVRTVEALFSVHLIHFPKGAQTVEVGLHTWQSTFSEMIGQGGREQLANQLVVLLFTLSFQGLNVRLFKPDLLSC